MRLPRKDRVDEKEMKKKVRKIEKDAIRELRKDTNVIQQQKQNERSQRRALSRKGVFKIGANLKDEISSLRKSLQDEISELKKGQKEQ